MVRRARVFRFALDVIRARIDHVLGARDLIRRVEPVENHLPQAQLGLGVVQGFLVVTARGLETGGGAVGAFAAIAGDQVNRWLVATLGDIDVFICREPVVHGGVNFRMGIEGALDRLCDRHGVDMGTGHR